MVIAIIGVLVALLLPAVQAAREAARRTHCKNNLKQMGLAINNYVDARKQFPAGSEVKGGIGTKTTMTWSVAILPYMEENTLFDRRDKTKVLEDSPNFERICQVILPAHICPSDQLTNVLQKPESGPSTDKEFAPGSYRAVSGRTEGTDGDLFFDNPNIVTTGQTPYPVKGWRGVLHTVRTDNPGGPKMVLRAEKIKDLIDGTSKTVMVSEYHTATKFNRRTLWAYGYTSYNQSSAINQGRCLLPDYDTCVNTGGVGSEHVCKRGFGSFHPGNILNCVMADGAVVSFSPDIDVSIWLAAATVGGKETSSSLGQ